METKERKPLVWEFWIYLILDFYTMTAVILRNFYSDSTKYTILYIDIGLTIIRVVFLVSISAKISRKAFAGYIFVPDLLMVCGLVSTVGYAYLGYTMKMDDADRYIFGSVNTLCFLFLMLSLNLVLRCFIKHLQWSRTKVICYKIVRAYSVFLYLVIILSEIAEGPNKELKYNEAIFSVYAILTLIYYEIMYGEFAAADGTAAMKLDFMIGSEEVNASKEQ